MGDMVLQIRSNGQITLPASARRLAKLKEGDLLQVVVDPDGVIRLVPQVTIDRAQAYFWTRRWQEGEREADEDIQAGRVEEFKDVEEAVAYLDELDLQGE